jgi:hypothetical protein
MQPGELIKRDIYLNMKVDNPIPWVGMSIWHRSTNHYFTGWYYVGGYNVGGQYPDQAFCTSATMRITMEKYHSVSTSSAYTKFVLPGQQFIPKNVPPLAYPPSDLSLVKKAFVWEVCKTDLLLGSWEQLIIPEGLTPGDVLPRLGENNLPEYTPEELKKLNSDGRNECIRCNSFLKTPYPGIIYCPVCEP